MIHVPNPYSKYFIVVTLQIIRDNADKILESDYGVKVLHNLQGLLGTMDGSLQKKLANSNPGGRGGHRKGRGGGGGGYGSSSHNHGNHHNQGHGHGGGYHGHHQTQQHHYGPSTNNYGAHSQGFSNHQHAYSKQPSGGEQYYESPRRGGASSAQVMNHQTSSPPHHQTSSPPHHQQQVNAPLSPQQAPTQRKQPTATYSPSPPHNVNPVSQQQQLQQQQLSQMPTLLQSRAANFQVPMNMNFPQPLTTTQHQQQFYPPPNMQLSLSVNVNYHAPPQGIQSATTKRSQPRPTPQSPLTPKK